MAEQPLIDRMIRPGGYSTLFAPVNRVFNFLLALILLLITLPVMAVLVVLIKVTDRGEVFYRGVRLGKDKKPFTMYKFRTLVPNAEQLIGGRLLHPGDKLVTWWGRYLRDTRLDELPQLFNVLKGDMNFVGPRPERPLIYDTICKHIDGYDKRFAVKPGLIGYSQVFTPYSADKRIRTLIDNKFVNRQQNFIFDILFVFFTFLILGRKAVKRLAAAVKANIIKGKLFGKYKEKRKYERVRQENARIFLGDPGEDFFTATAGMPQVRLIDINNEAFLMAATTEIDSCASLYTIEIEQQKRGRTMKKYARCSGKVFKSYEGPDEDGKPCFYSVVMYTPESGYSSYLVNKYLINESVT